MSRPHPDTYKLPDLEIDFSFRKLIVVSISLLVFLVLPIVVIDSLSKRPASPSLTESATTNITSGQVAGVSTSIYENTTTTIFDSFDLNSQAGVLSMFGFILVGIAALLAIYLIAEGALKKKMK